VHIEMIDTENRVLREEPVLILVSTHQILDVSKYRLRTQFEGYAQNL